MNKRILSMLLVLSVLLTGLTMAAFAAEAEAEVDGTPYASLADAILTANGKTVKLLKNVTLSSRIMVNQSLTLDLSGHTITGSSTQVFGITAGGNLTLTGTGVVTTTGAVAANSSVIQIWPGNSATQPAALTIDSNVKISAPSCIGITLYGTSTADAVLTVKGTVESSVKGASAIAGNGTFSGTSITIEPGAVITSGEAAAIFHPQNGTLTIHGGTITSVEAAVEMRAGTLNITGGTFTATSDTYSCSSKGSGATTIGAAIAIAQHTTENAIAVNISGGTFNGLKALNEANPEENPAPQVSISVTGGAFTGEISIEDDASTQILGGAFSTAPVGLLAPGYALRENGNGTWTVYQIPSTAGTPATQPTNPNAWGNPYEDVSADDWFYPAVRYVSKNGLMSGLFADRFAPSGKATRGMLMTILARLSGVNTANSDPWYAKGMAWAKTNEISDGTNPGAPITREQLVTMLYRYAAKNGMDAVTLAEHLSAFTDASSVSTYAVSAMNWAVGSGLIEGANNLLRPQSTATRAELAAILMRFSTLFGE